MHLTLRSYLIAAGIALLGIVGQWSHALPAHLWLLPLMLWLVALLREWIGVRGSERLHPDCQPPKQAELGQSISTHIRFDRPAGQPLTLEWQPWYPEGTSGQAAAQTLHCQPGAPAIITLSLIPVRLGEIRWPTVYFRQQGRLGLARWKRPAFSPGPLLVRPRRLNRPALHGGTDAGGGDAPASRGGSGLEFQRLREHMPGDPLRVVDWKATARSGTRMVRVFSEEQDATLLLVLDLGYGSGLESGGLTHLHHAINAASGLAELATLRGDRCGMLAFANDVMLRVPPMRGEAGLLQVREALEGLRSMPRESNPLKAALAVRQLLGQRALVVWFSEIDDPESASQLLRANTLLTPKHLPIVASIAPADVLELSRRRASHWLDPYRNYAADIWREDRQRTLERLRRLGVETVHAPAEQLDAAVIRRFNRLHRRRRI